MVTALGIVAGLLQLEVPAEFMPGALNFQLSAPAQGWQGWSVETIEAKFRPDSDALWMLLQWVIYRGHWLTVGIWSLLVAGTVGIKWFRARRSAAEEHHRPNARECLAALGHSLWQPALAWAAVALLVYLILAPHRIQTLEESYQDQMVNIYHPELTWNKFNQAEETVRADKAFMEQLRATIVETQ